MYNASLLLEHKRWHMDEYLDVLPHLQAADLAAFFPRLLSRVFVEAFIAGQESQCLYVAEYLECLLCVGEVQPPLLSSYVR
jgi:insulysin